MPMIAMPKRITSFVSTTTSSVRLDTRTPFMFTARNSHDHADREDARHRRARVQRVGRVAAERERVHGHRDHVAEDEQPQQQAGELRMTLLAQVVERPTGAAGTRGDARPRIAR